jgi:hypothetical protein
VPQRRNCGGMTEAWQTITWCVIALRWGWDIEETADRLMQESDKAQDRNVSASFL